MLKSLPTDLSALVDSIALTCTLEQYLTTDLPAIQNGSVSATADHWDDVDEDGDPRVETVALINIVKGSLVHGSLWDQLDAIEADLETVASSVLDVRSGDLLQEVIDRMQGAGSSLLILNSVTVAERWRGCGVGPLLAGEAILALGGDAQCVATYPAPLDGSQGVARERAVHKLERVWAQLGFEPLDHGVWILDPALVDLQEAVDRIRSNFGLS